MSIVTALTEKLGIEGKLQMYIVFFFQRIDLLIQNALRIVPVIQSGMQWVAYAELSSAVSNAGGLGIVRQQLCNERP
jgi:hypothetical protein